MSSTRFMFSVGSLLALFLIFTSGCKRPAFTKCQSSGPQKFIVDPTAPHGVLPADVSVCEGDTVEWKDNGHHFDVTFENQESPFSDGETHFNNGNPKSKGGKKLQGVTVKVFKFDISIDNGKPFDPHVVLGGGN
jgi:plastocyanin